MRELKQGPDPHTGAIVCVRGETVKAESETADLQEPKWNETQTVFATDIHNRSPGRRSSWELEFTDCGAILRRGLLLTAERRIGGM